MLESASDPELLTLLLQLVQALRYELNLEGVVATMGTSSANHMTSNSSVMLSIQNLSAEPSTKSIDSSEIVLEEVAPSKDPETFWCDTILNSSPLASFLVRRACSSYSGKYICIQYLFYA